ncbi:MAG: Membrane-bound lytic murein transglycosylase C [SAR92 bacterium MED-G29]|nr:MAG: Membrane-bound lytic murein transglycosylase C [SAR92 bacterium MED-G29]
MTLWQTGFLNRHLKRIGHRQGHTLLGTACFMLSVLLLATPLQGGEPGAALSNALGANVLGTIEEAILDPALDPTLVSKLKLAAAAAPSFDNHYDAQVWLVSKDLPLSALIKDADQRLKLLTLIHSEATLAKVSPEIVLALIEVESGFDSYAVSSAGAQGIMQVMPFWKKEIGRPEDNLINMQTNLRYGCTILKHYLDIEQGRLADALARYNGSYGQYWYAERVLDAWAERWR